MTLKNTLKVSILLFLLIVGITIISGCLKHTSPNPIPTQLPSPKTTIIYQQTSLSQVKVASVYERVTEDIRFNRNLNTVINIFKETNTDLIFRGFFRWQPVPETSTSIMPGYSQDYVTQYAKAGYTYEQLKNAIDQIKASNPNTLFVGAIAAQRLNKIEFNDVTHESFTQPQTWAMALEPSEINPNYTKEEFQCLMAKRSNLIGDQISCPSGYNPESVPAYYPDITNEQYQKLLVSWAEKQIDLGADAIWIDMLFSQTNLILGETGNPNHPAAKTSYDASSKIVDEIHAYGSTKYNKHIYVGTWSYFVDFPYPPPDVDFVTIAIPAQEIKSGLNDGDWNAKKENITRKKGNIPILVFIDWSGSATAPMGVFSQTLTPAQQSEFLVKADDFFTKKGLIFVYPVHGGTFPPSSARLSFGEYNIYDSIAPEFNTYGTIKDLALKKVGVK